MRPSARHVAIALSLTATACVHDGVPVGEGARPALPEPAMAFVNPDQSVADYLACLRDQQVMILSAHRGGPQPGFAENSLETFANTLAYAPFLIETDVRMTADGVFVLLHDEDLERTTTGTGPISETKSSDLAAVTLLDDDNQPTPHAIPTLDDALGWARHRAILQLDVKSGAPIEEVARLVVDRGAQGFAAVIAYSVEDALAAAAVSDELTVSVEIMDIATLDTLEASGLPAKRIMAWTGIETERPELWAALNARGVSAAWGSLWYLDREIMESGNTSEFARLAEDGLDVLSSDIHLDAHRAVETRQDTLAAVSTCNTRR